MTTLFPLARLLDAGFSPFPELESFATTQTLIPRADVLEGDREFRILMDLPGVSNDELEINLENQTLTVKAKVDRPEAEGFAVRRHERANQMQFSRTFDLGTAIEQEHIAAKLEAGVLQITLPKSETSMPRRIEVK